MANLPPKACRGSSERLKLFSIDVEPPIGGP
jgi:hypothetical protein